ncbi:MAG: peptide MFS transporter [Ignavibacteriales bacterium]|nr:MAG: peptide MFS transporter [Ignavibacteriaceae bacterium]MBW7872314.1 peptide MFS transporter [Ignavibacteria bacterium]MCZ2142597.1 peptide MFS transporter [Ignavibacteriales bacterium]OQY76247.1 MAG: MFS transporter [Ignavibacteriales bacterium UTCHB3]MBV6445539.1 Dipeptide and tripeptide permease A [Ignavibacteriaceae bacterium]
MFKEHPSGLPVLFFTEMWERFGYYLMLGIFLLYMTDFAPLGLGYSNEKASDVYGTYIALVYLTPFLGGLLADRVLGYIKSIIIGGLLMALGYFGLAIPGDTYLWPALFLIIFGNGFFKPNISTLVGNLYADEKFKKLKDTGYNIFYMGINIGAFVCNFVAAYLRNEFGWGFAFAGAGIGMLIGVLWFISGLKHVREADVKKPVQAEDASMMTIVLSVFLPATIAAVIGYFVPTALFGKPLLGSVTTDAFIFASIPIVIFYFSLWFRASKADKDSIAALLSIFTVVIIFWAIFHQNGAALTVWARDYTDRQLPTFVESVASPLGLTEEYYKDVLIVKNGEETTEIPKALIISKTDSEIKYKTNSKEKQEHTVKISGASLTDGEGAYFKNMSPELKKDIPGDKPYLTISTEIFQSINPFWIVVLTPVVVSFFTSLRRKGKEPSTAGKIGWGLFITAISTIVMMLAVVFSENGAIKGSAGWLVGTYFVITIGELCLSPMGLSLVSKVSPQRLTALMMGGWFLSTSIGNKLSGVISGLWNGIDNKVYFFMINFVAASIAALAIFVMIKWLRRVIAQHEH